MKISGMYEVAKAMPC